MKPQLIKSDIKLTIGMLVSNHIQYIRKAMEALKPLLEAVPSELVVIDTKGEETDGSIDIVREYTDKIYRFTWCNDFAAARNFCLEHASGEWFLYQDDDEWFDNVQEFIDFFQSGECEKYYSGFYYTRDYHASGGFSMGIAGRMIRRTVNTRFVGKVHETFNEVFAPNKQFECFTHHMGYAFVADEDKKRHQDRNISILKEELKEYGYTPRLCAQMTQELMYRDATLAQGFTFAESSIRELEKKRELVDSCAQWILVSTVRFFSRQGNYEELRKQAEKIRKGYALSQMAELAISAVVARKAGEQGDMDTLIENTERYLSSWDWLKANKEEALLQTQMDFPRYYSETYYFSLLHAAAIAENHKQNYVKAEEYWKRIPWDREGFDGSGYYADMQITYEGMKKARQSEETQGMTLQKEAGGKNMNKQQITEIYALLNTIAEALAYLNEQEDELVRSDVTAGRAQLTDFIEREAHMPIREWIDADLLSDADWLQEMYRVMDEIEYPMVIRNKYDKEFMLLIKYMRASKEETLLAFMKKKLQETKTKDPQVYQVFAEYFNRFPFWGSFHPDEGDYTAFELRARVLKRRSFEFLWLYKRMEDYLSKRTLTAILSNWAILDMNNALAVKSIFMDYYEPDIFPDNTGDVLVDVGAYIGDSILNYVKMYGENYKKIYAYEISEKTCRILLDNTKELANVIIKQKGLGSKAGHMAMVANSNASANMVGEAEETAGQNDQLVEIVALDEDITEDNVTFIKMDIEGAEEGAIRGCERIIKEQHPKLAICTYHGYDDIWRLPTLIDEIYPGYQFYMRHNGGNLIPTEFVLLCKDGKNI